MDRFAPVVSGLPRLVLKGRRWLVRFIAIICVLVPLTASPQALTGAVIGTVRDEQGAVLVGSSSASQRECAVCEWTYRARFIRTMSA